MTLLENLRSARASYHMGKGDFLGQQFQYKRLVFLQQDDLKTKDFLLSHWRADLFSYMVEIYSGTTHNLLSHSRLREIRQKNSLYKSDLFLSRGLFHFAILSQVSSRIIIPPFSICYMENYKAYLKINTILYLPITWKQIITKESSKLYKNSTSEMKHILKYKKLP